MKYRAFSEDRGGLLLTITLSQPV